MIIAALTTTVHSVALDRELTESADFRVRVQAALRLAKAGASSRPDLEAGLKDSHPAVRIACAGGLKDIGDAAAIPALTRALSGESYAGAKTTMQDAIDKLKAGGAVKQPGGNTSLAGAHYVVQLGAMKNVSGSRGDDLDAIMRSAARAKAGSIKHAVVIDGSDPGVLKRATAANIPVLQIDGNLTKLTSSKGTDGATVVSAKVDMSVRKLPAQTLKGTVSGNASGSAGSSRGTSDQGIRELQNRVVGGAVESAVGSMGNELASLSK
ncbi:MAG: HEAT repeat domain-containing protein [Labilithrix sp.]|nr:HEAT repeat domain-containing protein [Labilithrix sp.]MCW5812422.1 HEAT repeat domain-containing protein [Labilithrix sp.]